MTVEGRIRVESHTGKVRLPREAILERDGGRTLLFRLLNGDSVEWIYIEPEFATSEWVIVNHDEIAPGDTIDRKSTRLNSSHVAISYAVFCLKKKKNTRRQRISWKT